MSQETKRRYLGLFGVILALGLMGAAFILGQQFKNLRQPGVITVKGVAEAEHTASIGTWQIQISAWGQSYEDAMKNTQKNLNAAVKFLSSQGFTEDERNITSLYVNPYTELHTDEFGKDRYRQNGFTGGRSIHLSTKDLAKLQKAVSEIQNLRAENQNISFYEPDYYLEDLETIKRDLISKATKDAYMRAEEFAKTSNVKVGLLRSASQGYFEIKAVSAEGDSDYDGDGYDTSTIDKKVRLVVTIQYAID